MKANPFDALDFVLIGLLRMYPFIPMLCYTPVLFEIFERRKMQKQYRKIYPAIVQRHEKTQENATIFYDYVLMNTVHSGSAECLEWGTEKQPNGKDLFLDRFPIGHNMYVYVNPQNVAESKLLREIESPLLDKQIWRTLILHSGYFYLARGILQQRFGFILVGMALRPQWLFELNVTKRVTSAFLHETDWGEKMDKHFCLYKTGKRVQP